MTKKQGKSAFHPPKLPPQIDYGVLVEPLAKAHAELARLDETLRHIRNPMLLERTFLTREAVLSSQIEGTQATLEEVLEQEAHKGDRIEERGKRGQDIREILNYRRALREGVKLIDAGESLGENNVKELHRILLQSVRGKTRAPGEFRKNQVWIAPPGTPMTEARYIPPEPPFVPELYGDFDRYLNKESAERDVLVQIAVAHYQFEAIHPFSDGNGRVGRLLIPLFLYQRKILSQPLMYMSKYLEEHRRDYYDLLADVSYKKAWVPWTRFFLYGLCEQAQDANRLAHKIIALHDSYRDHIAEFNSPYASALLDAIFTWPVFTPAIIREKAHIQNHQTLLSLIKKFTQRGILKDNSPERQRGKTYKFETLLKLIEEYSHEGNQL